MRYVFGFLSVFALSLMLGLGCGETAPEPECETTADCDDQNDCTHEHCAGGTCQRATSYEGQRCDNGDDNECTFGVCMDAVCTDPGRGWVDYGTPCESDGVSGVCACGVCGEDPCEGDPCDDGNECTEDWCSPCDGSCHHESFLRDCEPCDQDGVPGVCVDGVCEEDPVPGWC